MDDSGDRLVGRCRYVKANTGMRRGELRTPTCPEGRFRRPSVLELYLVIGAIDGALVYSQRLTRDR